MEIENNRIGPAVTQNSGQGTPVENQANRNSESSSKENQSAAGSSDRVSLTDTARQLQDLEAQVASQPVVDSQRVNAVRDAIDNGTFTVDPARIADKMISLEQALTEAR